MKHLYTLILLALLTGALTVWRQEVSNGRYHYYRREDEYSATNVLVDTRTGTLYIYSAQKWIVLSPPTPENPAWPSRHYAYEREIP